MVYKRKPLTAREIIRRQYKGSKNIMTPDQLKFGKINKNVAFELSQGRGFNGGKLYGVTVVSVNKKLKTRPQWDLSKAFGSKNDAEAYINKLKAKMKKNRAKRR